jgi:ATP phosphoribosyltransferase regulatory subunit HisZ
MTYQKHGENGVLIMSTGKKSGNGDKLLLAHIKKYTLKKYTDMKEIKKYIDEELNKVERGLIAIPTEEYLNTFTKANNGSNDFLLMQMAKNYGYKLALENLKKEI